MLDFTEVDKNQARYVRYRDSDNKKYCECISCGRPAKREICRISWYNNSTKLRFHEKNTNAQCISCVKTMNKNYRGHRFGMIERYGEKIFDELELAARIAPLITQETVDDLALDYMDKLEIMLENEKEMTENVK